MDILNREALAEVLGDNGLAEPGHVILVDVNVIAYAARREFREHEAALVWLQQALGGDEPVAVLDQCPCCSDAFVDQSPRLARTFRA